MTENKKRNYGFESNFRFKQRKLPKLYIKMKLLVLFEHLLQVINLATKKATSKTSWTLQNLCFSSSTPGEMFSLLPQAPSPEK